MSADMQLLVLLKMKATQKSVCSGTSDGQHSSLWYNNGWKLRACRGYVCPYPGRSEKAAHAAIIINAREEIIILHRALWVITAMLLMWVYGLMHLQRALPSRGLNKHFVNEGGPKLKIMKSWLRVGLQWQEQAFQTWDHIHMLRVLYITWFDVKESAGKYIRTGQKCCSV